MSSFYKKGAEAKLFQSTFENEKVIVKKRIPKNYRDKKLDDLIRKKRTRAEAKLIKTASSYVNVPRVFLVNENEFEIIMSFVEGEVLKNVLDKNKKYCVIAGEQIRKLHDGGLIHGDLTTSNMVLENKTGKVFFVDFGLGFFSKKIEDQATDLVVFKKTFNATHSSIKDGWKLVLKGYNPSQEIISQMENIEKRARYH